MNKNNNDGYFENSTSSPNERKGTEKKDNHIIPNFSTDLDLNKNENISENITTDLNSSYISDEDDNQEYNNEDEDYDQQDDHYKSDFFNSVSKNYKNTTPTSTSTTTSTTSTTSTTTTTNKAHINNIENDSNNNNNNSNSNNIVLVNTKNTLQYSQKETNKIRKKNTKKLLEYDKNNLECALNRLKNSSNYCGSEFSRLLLSVNSICNNITKLSHDNMENYSNIIDKTTFESVKCAESMKMLINNMELLNSDIFEIYKLNNQIKNVKKDVDQLEFLMKSLIKQ
ncbi:hypothetical protein ACTFIW_000663 [Dictyostelium discoideum]